MDGTIGLDSDIGKGSCFWLKVKFEKNDILNTEESIITPIDMSQFHNINVLLVEDNAINQMIATAILLQGNVNIICANNGEEGLQKLLTHDIDIILMDIHMPIMDGYTASTAIRELMILSNATPLLLPSQQMLCRTKLIYVGYTTWMTI